MTFYIDDEYKIHTKDEYGLIAIETDFFNGKCETFIEGHRFVPADEMWMREDGEKFSNMIAPWKDLTEAEAAQREYEREQLAVLKAQNADMAAALEVLGVSE